MKTTRYALDPNNPPKLIAKRLKALDAAPIVYDEDLPEPTAEFLAKAARADSEANKQQVTMRIDADVLSK